MPDLYLALGTLGIVAALIGLSAVVAVVRNHGQRLGKLEKDLEHLKAHGAVRRATVEITEDLTDTLLQLVEDESVMHARMDNLLTKIEFIRHTGKKNAPWAEIINWKNNQGKK
jgi:hypothetical protein